MTDADRLLREIIANPADDLLRLAYADAIEERRGPGDEAWAAFVRVQVELAKRDDERCGCRECRPNGQHNNGPCRSPLKELRRRERDLWPAVRPVFDGYGWISCLEGSAFSKREAVSPSNAILIVRRGLPAVVRCNLQEWRGGECERCGGTGIELIRSEERGGLPGGSYSPCVCPDHSGRTPGIGPRLAQRWPVEEVQVTDKRPFENGFGGFSWFDSEWPHDDDDGHGLPVEVFRLLKGGNSEGLKRVGSKEYPTEAAALAAGSDAMLAEARAQPLEVTT